MANELANYEGEAEQHEPTSGTQMATTRQAQEVQAAMIVARRFPRDEMKSLSRIVESCKRIALAEGATYEYSRGGQTISGPSIRLAETMARAWGNLDFGIIELERKRGESTVMAYCWDLETNTRQTKVFAVRHMRDTKRGSYELTDERDIYETVANNAARRLRACILGIIPGDVQDKALEQCQRTLVGKSDKPLADQIAECVEAFKQFGVTPNMIEARVQHRLQAITPHELARLRRVFVALRDRVTDVAREFPEAEAPVDENSDAARVRAASERLKQRAAGQQPTQQSAEPTQQSSDQQPPAATSGGASFIAEAEAAGAATQSSDEQPKTPGDYSGFLAKLQGCVTKASAEKLHDEFFGRQSRFAWTPQQNTQAMQDTGARIAALSRKGKGELFQRGGGQHE